MWVPNRERLSSTAFGGPGEFLLWTKRKSWKKKRGQKVKNLKKPAGRRGRKDRFDAFQTDKFISS